MRVQPNEVLQKDEAHFYRVLHVAEPHSWLIRMEVDISWPFYAPYRDVLDGDFGTVIPYRKKADAYPDLPDEVQTKAIALEKKLTAGLLSKIPDIFDSKKRGRLVEAFAKTEQMSETTVRRYLRVYWMGGQNFMALVHLTYLDPKVRQPVGVTAGRGRLSSIYGKPYQMTDADKKLIIKYFGKHFLHESEPFFIDIHEKFINEHYFTVDGNRFKHPSVPGKYPTIDQVKTVINRAFSPEEQLRKRMGEERYLNMMAPATGNADQAGHGVGHKYLIDATILDLWTISSKNIRFLVGKPTLYLIIDLASRLVVGFYVCLYSPCWMGALMAILSISEDKEALCKRHSIPYIEEEWPAHMVFPESFLGDRGEMASNNSERLPGLNIELVNTRSRVPRKKAVIETRFKTFGKLLKKAVPGYQPPLEATIRCGKGYEKDAKLDIDGVIGTILKAVLHHNKNVIKSKKFDYAAFRDVDGIPLTLWEDGIRFRSGRLRRIAYDQVWRKLMPRDKCRIDDEGIIFKGMTYDCPAARRRGMFIKRRGESYKPEVIWNPRLCDKIWIEIDGKWEEAELVEWLHFLKGCPVAEAEARIRLYGRRKRLLAGTLTMSLSANFRQYVADLITSTRVEENMKQLGRMTRSGRKSDTKQRRDDDAQARAVLENFSPGSGQTPAQRAVAPVRPLKVPARPAQDVPLLPAQEASASDIDDLKKRILDSF